MQIEFGVNVAERRIHGRKLMQQPAFVLAWFNVVCFRASLSTTAIPTPVNAALNKISEVL